MFDIYAKGEKGAIFKHIRRTFCWKAQEVAQNVSGCCALAFFDNMYTCIYIDSFKISEPCFKFRHVCMGDYFASVNLDESLS